jgi:hypothetical protein
VFEKLLYAIRSFFRFPLRRDMESGVSLRI